MMDLTDKEYWEDVNIDTEIGISSIAGSIIKKYIMMKYIPDGKNKSCFEIGCYPSRYLAYLHDFRYELNGIDIVQYTDAMNHVLREKGCNVGQIQRIDFFSYKPKRLYDLVCSFGFIKHFDDYLSVIDKHCKLLKDEGLLLVTVPNFYGKVQQILHRYLDKKSLERHNLNAMEPTIWAEELEKTGIQSVGS